MKIGALAKETGVSVRMLRYYEAEGLLAPARTSGGYRDYGSADRDTVERIKNAGRIRNDVARDPKISALCA